MNTIPFLDLFAGCGGLSEGFKASKAYRLVAAVEWDRYALRTLRARATFHGIPDPERRCLHFDIRRSEELFSGWDEDPVFGTAPGIDHLVQAYGSPRVVLGGPPCQAYSVAGRVRDPDGMRNDYRNYLFESYLNVLTHYQPDVFVFENVQGMLTAAPDGRSILERVRAGFDEIGYTLPRDIAGQALYDAKNFGVPQGRKRLIIFGVRRRDGIDADVLINTFYSELSARKSHKVMTVRDAIGDLPALQDSLADSYFPLSRPYDHVSRYHNERDKRIFSILAADALLDNPKFQSDESLHRLYKRETGNSSRVHKYHVLKWDVPSTTIVAHLEKDGLRHIHPDPMQARSISVREAARLQSFPDDYEFLGSQGSKYRMIGNAVPPLMARAIAEACTTVMTAIKARAGNLARPQQRSRRVVERAA